MQFLPFCVHQKKLCKWVAFLLQGKNNFGSLKKCHGAGIPQDLAKFIQLFLASERRNVTVLSCGQRVGRDPSVSEGRFDSALSLCGAYNTEEILHG